MFQPRPPGIGIVYAGFVRPGTAMSMPAPAVGHAVRLKASSSLERDLQARIMKVDGDLLTLRASHPLHGKSPAEVLMTGGQEFQLPSAFVHSMSMEAE